MRRWAKDSSHSINNRDDLFRDKKSGDGFGKFLL